MVNIVSNQEKPEIDKMADLIKRVPEPAQLYILGCIDMARLMTSQTTAPENPSELQVN